MYFLLQFNHKICSFLQTIRFKSYLLSMGIANPVTRETHGSGTHYHLQLAKQLGTMLQAPLEVSVRFCAICVTYLRSYAKFNLLYCDIRVSGGLSFFSCLLSLSGARGYDGAHGSLLSRQPCQRDGGDAYIHMYAHSCQNWPLNGMYVCVSITQLLSPEDLVNACKMFESLKLPLRFVPFHVYEYIWSEPGCVFVKDI